MRAAVLVGLLAVVACDSNLFDDCYDRRVCGNDPADGGSDSSSSADASTSDANVDTSPPCDLTGDPASAPCSVSDANGVFVSPSGSDASGDGRQAHPYASIGVAVTKAKAAAMARVFVCAGTYGEALSLGASASGMKVYGGLSCATWTYAPSNVVSVSPSGRGPALTVDGARDLTIEDVRFTAQSGSVAGDSSIGAVVNVSTGITFHRAVIVAQDAVKGSDGTPSSAVLPVAASGKPADNAPGVGGGAPVTCTCPFGASSLGGQGGSGGNLPTPGQDGAPGTSNKGAGGATCSNGTKGTDGAVGANQPGASTPGAVNGLVWAPSAGTKGQAGVTGQGGGGGGGILGPGNGGGSGGCGGCGGQGGEAGTGGGASIALLAVASTVTLTQSLLVSAKGGDGGKGAPGQAGAAGGARGGGSPLGSGCQGGAGGRGGQAGAGGGGAGGPSVGVFYTATAPVLDATTSAQITTGAGGAGGLGGSPGTNDGLLGAVTSTLHP